jgi:Ca-activated chloride channel homolog
MRRKVIAIAAAISGALSLAAGVFLLTCCGAVGGAYPGAMSPGQGGAEAGQDLGVAPLAADELWVIARSDAQKTPRKGAEERSPALKAVRPGSSEEIPLPLERTAVRAQIDGYVASVEVEQRYRNPYPEKIEVVYVFPLPQDAAVSDFLMQIGDRTIRGVIREREEAERIYEEAKSQGFVASLLTEERPNVFTQRVANIEPGKRIDVQLTYYNTLPYRDGAYVFEFPTVVGPRFDPPGSTDGVGAVARGANGLSGQSTEVQYLKPGEESGADFTMVVDLDAGTKVTRVDSPSHEIAVETVSPNRRRIELAGGAARPDKDFVLTYAVAGETVRSAFLLHEDARGRFFTLVLTPPAEAERLRRAPIEQVFVLDTSGSMDGEPIAIVKQAVRRALEKLEPTDSFQIIRFSNDSSALGPAPIPADARNIRRGLDYVDDLEGEGGTMMIEGIKAALDFPHEEGKVRVVSFMTDGYIGNEAEILAAIHGKLGRSKIFSFGVGSAPNRYLLEQMAKLGQGAVAYVTGGREDEDAVDAFYDRISHPALADIAIDWRGMKVTDVFPSRIPDLWSGRPVVIAGRLEGGVAKTVRVEGRIGGEGVGYEVPIAADGTVRRPAIAQVWARMQIADLAERSMWQEDKAALTERIKSVALNFSLLSKFTAFVAVDASRVTEGDHGTTVVQPVAVPDGVRYETTVADPANAAAAESGI